MNTSTYSFNKIYIFIINVLMGIYSIKILWEGLEHFVQQSNLNSSFCIGEFLINYQGGFVRRGLLGDILFRYCSSFGLNPQLIVKILCATCIIIVVWFFVVQFKRNSICWWILPLNLCLANLDIIRKDYLFVVSLITILYCYKIRWGWFTKILLINAIAVFTILTHEAFFFFCIPLLCWMIFKDKSISNNIITRILSFLPMIITMFIVCVYHGDSQTSTMIAESWATALGIKPETLIPKVTLNGHEAFSGAIGSLSWTTQDAITYHNYVNFKGCYLGIPGYFTKPITFIIVFYFLLNYISLFSTISDGRKLYLSRLLIFQFFSLLPLFTLLSCDTSRIYFYWFTSSFVFFFLSNISFPIWFETLSKSVHDFMTINLIPPTWLIIILLFTLSVPYSGSNLIYMWQNNVIMQIYRLFHVGLNTIF